MSLIKLRTVKILLLSAVLAFFCLQTVMAEPQLQPEVLEALKSSRQRKKNCQPPQKLPVKSLTATAMPDFSADMSCALPATEISHKLQDPKITLVDTRQAAEFDQSHIPGAIRLTVGELAKKPYLQDKPVILIGNGKAERELYSQCQQLKLGGFSRINVLWGGMPAWLTSGFDVEGQPDQSDLPVNLTAGELWLESKFKANLIVVTKAQSSLIKYLPGAHMLADDKPSTIKSALKRYGKKPPAAIVMTATANTDVQAIRQLLKPVPLLVYTEGADTFARQLQEQKAVWEAYTRGPKQPSTCKRQSGL